MDKDKFVVGARVYECGDRSYKGTIVDMPADDVLNLDDRRNKDDMFNVQWDSRSHKSPMLCNKCNVRLIDEEADKARAAKVQVKVNEAATSLKAAFDAWQEAADLAGGKYELTHDDLIDISEFEKVIDATGWEMSSIYC